MAQRFEFPPCPREARQRHHGAGPGLVAATRPLTLPSHERVQIHLSGNRLLEPRASGGTPEDGKVVREWAQASTTEQRLALRARVILAAARNESTTRIAARERVRAATVSKWRQRYARGALVACKTRRDPGPRRRYDEATEQRVLKQLDQPPPPGYARWNGRLLAQALGDVSPRQVWRILSGREISLARRRRWCISTDPEFARKAADIVGIYLHPPENAVILCVDEKPHIQVLERAQGYLRLPNGKTLSGFSHDYKRHGTTTLFAAFQVLTGHVPLVHHRQRRTTGVLGLHE